MASILYRSARRDRAAFIFRRIAMPERLLNDAWWLRTSPSSAAEPAREDIPATEQRRLISSRKVFKRHD
jgi:hypothetical protein